jgi:ABC-2 type transport system ATP-binding protein
MLVYTYPDRYPGQMLRVESLSKRYGARRAVDDVTFTVEPGRVTGFLGPNGAGKSTTMRLILGLARADAGNALIDGRPLAEHPSPMRSVGALLDAGAVHPGRTAWSHLRALAATHRIPKRRVDDVIDEVGLSSVADRRVGRFSLGMRQRLGLAAALLGDPGVLILDEPVNGLDPEGVLWTRELLRSLADEGRTVFLSSHLMGEMALTADHLIVIGRGRILVDASLSDVLSGVSEAVRVVATEPVELRRALERAGIQVAESVGGALDVRGASAETVGRVALAAGVAVCGLGPVPGSLEAAYFRLTDAEVEYRAGVGG